MTIMANSEQRAGGWPETRFQLTPALANVYHKLLQREVRRVYSLLMDEDIDEFAGWTTEPGYYSSLSLILFTQAFSPHTQLVVKWCSVTYKDSRNQAILSKLVREVKAQNQTFLTEHIKGTTKFSLIWFSCQSISQAGVSNFGDTTSHVVASQVKCFGEGGVEGRTREGEGDLLVYIMLSRIVVFMCCRCCIQILSIEENLPIGVG